MIRFQYTVKGPGTFPVDMLRYDGSFPESEEDSHKIERTFTEDFVVVSDPIRLGRWSDDTWSPHRKRWESFGWHVVWESTL